MSKTFRDAQGRFITTSDGLTFLSDERGNPLVDDDGFVTYFCSL
ncbi:hypothetical protein SAMN04487926_12131 [Paraburkholderia steynii]|uniref:Uncharacterized protein n=1 Tax=Paraburkholderia steynii TaxID=1245441 RepID=A0A7Z7FJS0_9BURK|nr:hypothetical protein [Paraburkholderia steynii]SDI64801.1 hypothetical protein SAMN04487926_12131 [Paraburkholderia steynii]